MVYKADTDEELEVYTTTYGAVENIQDGQAIWTRVDEDSYDR